MTFIKSDKRGLSEIVTSILIILIAVAAVVVIWQVLLPLIRNPGEQSASLADCTANPVTISNPQCADGGALTVTVSKLGSKVVPTGSLRITRSDGTNLNTAGTFNNIAGSQIVSVTDANFDNQNGVVITGTYTLQGSSGTCNIPEARTVNCP